MSSGLSLITLTDSWKVTLFSARCSRDGTSLASSAGRHPFCTTHTHIQIHTETRTDKETRELQGGSVKEPRVKTHKHTQVCTAVVQLIHCSSRRQQELLPPEGSAAQTKGFLFSLSQLFTNSILLFKNETESLKKSFVFLKTKNKFSKKTSYLKSKNTFHISTTKWN